MALSLLGLPNEVLTGIGKLLNRTADINSLARTNKLLFSLFDEYLYTFDQTEAYFLGSSLYLPRAVPWAATNGSIATMRKAINAGADVNACFYVWHDRTVYQGDYIGPWTPLCLAVLKQDAAMVQYLVDRGADANGKVPVFGRFPLWIALIEGHFDMVVLLASLGASSQPRPNRSTLELAIETHDTDLVGDLLLLLYTASGKFISTENAFHAAMMCPDEAVGLWMMKLLLGCRRLDPNWPFAEDWRDDYAGMTPLAAACDRRRVDLVRALLSDDRVKPNKPSPPDELRPMERILRHDGVGEIVAALLEHHLVEYDCFKIFRWACREGNHAIASQMIDKEEIFDRYIMKGWVQCLNPGQFPDLQARIAQYCKEYDAGM